MSIHSKCKKMYWTPLINLCVTDQELPNEKLSKYKKLVNITTPTNTTPLHFVALGNNIMLGSWLIKKGAIIKANLDGQTPLHWACKSGNLKMIELLLNNMKKDQIRMQDIENKSAYDWALEYLNEEAAAMIQDVITRERKTKNWVKKFKFWQKKRKL